jgi:preprotein translocase subunit SecG
MRTLLAALFILSDAGSASHGKELMTTILTIIHIVVSLFLIVIVLLQHGKGADMGAAFGGSSQTLFGTEGPLPLLNKITTASAIVFMVTSLGLAILASGTAKKSVMSGYTPPAATQPQTDQPQQQIIPMPSTTTEEGQSTASSPALLFPVDSAAPPVEPLQATQDKPAAEKSAPESAPSVPAGAPVDKTH